MYVHAHTNLVCFMQISPHTHTRVSELLADRVGVAFTQRPASGNISVTASLGSLTMNGRGQGGGEPPTIIQTNQLTAGIVY